MSFYFLLIITFAYLLGSINSAIIVSKINQLPDPRTKGSSNPGATNIYRIAGRNLALLVLAFDTIKGIIATWGSYYLGFTPVEIGLTAIACCLGHMYPIFFGFKGGKGVATAFGCLLPVGFSLGIALLVVWLTVFRISGYSSLSAIIAVGMAPIATWVISEKYIMPVLMLAILIIVRHTPNIYRLLNGTEPKSNQKLKL